ncbi:MAG: cupin domain-containing protein [Gammaproteobacteria bacterium]|jgi:cupin 2 domain-containing protein
MVEPRNVYKLIPEDLSEEVTERLVQSNNVKIERIISMGHTSPDAGWYDQEQNEWVLVLKGTASIAFENEAVANLEEGDYIHIPAHQKHRVISTSSVTETIWLAIFY